MNAMSIVMHLLSRKVDNYRYGATKNEILKALSFSTKNKNANVYIQDLLANIAKYIEPIGLQIKFNPIDNNWFITYEMEISNIINANPFEGKPRLAATLFCTIICCLKNSGVGKIHQIKELRKKKSILEDLRELEDKGYLEIDDNQLQVRLTPLIGYQLDLNKLFLKLALKLK
jgi:hypothetical protein